MNKRINYLSVFLSVLSLGAFVISFFTLQEMKSQRELDILPIVHHKDFKTLNIELDSSCDSVVYPMKIKAGIKKEDVYLEDWFQLEFINVGRGSAIDINVDWHINNKSYMNYLDSIRISSDLFEMKYDDSIEDNPLYFLKIPQCNGTIASMVIIEKNEDNLTYILPAGDDPEGVSLNIPDHVRSFIGN